MKPQSPVIYCVLMMRDSCVLTHFPGLLSTLGLDCIDSKDRTAPSQSGGQVLERKRAVRPDLIGTDRVRTKTAARPRRGQLAGAI